MSIPHRVHACKFVVLSRIEAQFTALQYFALDGTDHPSHQQQASLIRRYIISPNNHAYDQRLCSFIDRQTLPDAALGRQTINHSRIRQCRTLSPMLPATPR